MKPSRDRVKKRAGRKVQPQVSDREVVEKVNEFCRLMRQQNKVLLGLIQRQRDLILRTVRPVSIQ